MSVLEGRYRGVLRLLPASYRDVWEEEMVATFLDSVATDDVDEAEYLDEFGRPSWSEVGSVVTLAIQLRLGGHDAPPRAFVWGEAVRTVGLVGLLTFALALPMDLAQLLWIAGGLPLPAATREALAGSPPPDLWATAWIAAGALWLVAYLLLVMDRRRASLLLALLGLGFAVGQATVASAELAAGRAPATSLLTPWILLLISVVVVMTLAAFHRQAPPVRRRPWLLALAVGAVLSCVPGVLVLMQPIDMSVLDWPGLLCVGWIVAALVHLADPARRAASASLAVVLLCAPVLLLRIGSLLEYLATGYQSVAPLTVSLGIVEAVVVLALAIPLAVQTMRRLPRPPVAAVPPVPTQGRR